MAGGMLLAIDRNDEAAKLIRSADEIATRLGEDLTVLHVVTERELELERSDAPSAGAYVDVVLDRIREEIEEEVRTHLGRQPKGEILVRVARGEPDEVVLNQLRDEEFAFAVIGIRSRSRVSKLVFGSVAQSILLLSPCPVISIPTGE